MPQPALNARMWRQISCRPTARLWRWRRRRPPGSGPANRASNRSGADASRRDLGGTSGPQSGRRGGQVASGGDRSGRSADHPGSARHPGAAAPDPQSRPPSLRLLRDGGAAPLPGSRSRRGWPPHHPQPRRTGGAGARAAGGAGHWSRLRDRMPWPTPDLPSRTLAHDGSALRPRSSFAC